MRSEAPDGAAAPPTEHQPSLLSLLALLVRRRRLLIGLPLLTAVAAFGVSLLLPHLYTVEARFTPESGDPKVPGQLGALASQFGVDFGSMGQSGESLDFYAELLESRELLRAAVLTEYSFLPREATDPARTIRGNLVELFEAEGETPDERIFDAVETLDELVAVRPDAAADIVTVEVSAPWRELSVLLGQRILELVNEFNLQRRQTRAAAERAFLDARVEEVGSDLQAAERELEEFLSGNLRYDAPELRFQENRLQRKVDHAQQIHTGLLQSLEQARLDEVRNTPVITVLDQPRAPAERTAPNYVLNILLGLFVGGLIALGVVIGSDLMQHARASRPAEFSELESVTREALNGLTPRLRRSSSTRSPSSRP